MLRLDMTRKPAWHDMPGGVRLKLLPITTALMAEARRDPDVVEALQSVPPEAIEAEADAAISRATDEAVAIPFAVALARLAIVEWDGVGDARGNPVEPGTETIPALMDIWPIFEAFQTRYVQKGLLLEQEKNASAPSQPGSGAGARSTAQGAKGRARTARKRKSAR
ncbi:hypothetical protein [Roseisalinus antarcticus]|uniref:Uncharacterized protein n=1 Tax=Roseisalinus antarcticus TaxID=254357 RepID=A0A1Y5U4B9_9RHOB|nr:hypothetical protein [Roseisalinus antarcticus]SLN77947.1 hypothetical protein ROA7023_04595 [Roseisalinus antarcticus]